MKLSFCKYCMNHIHKPNTPHTKDRCVLHKKSIKKVKDCVVSRLLIVYVPANRLMDTHNALIEMETIPVTHPKVKNAFTMDIQQSL